MAIFSRFSYTFSMLVVLGYAVLSIGILQYPTRTCAALDQVCDGSKYSAGSEFERNLKRVLYYLANNASDLGFDTFQYGRHPNRVFGLLQCRGDATPTECRNCSQNAGVEIRETCPEATGAIAWFDQCFLRYQNKNFILGLTSENYVGSICNNVVASNPEAYTSAIKELMRTLAAKASAPGSRGFAFGQMETDHSNQTIYGIVQCLQLASLNCSKCVSDAISGTPKNCFTKSGGQVLSSNCQIRFGRDKFYDSELSSQEIASVQKPSSYSREKTPRKMTLKLVIILAILGVALLGSVIWLVKFTTSSKMRETPFLKTVTDDEEETQEENSGNAFSQQEQIFFKLKTLKLATRNFEDENKIGEGGFGPVYKGILSDGREIAVKKLSVKSKQGKTEFMNEVKIVAKIQHRNLVKLLGCCAARMEKLLVYEYMPNNSLDKILFDPERCRILDWQKRYNIILGVARGLLYLHEDSQPRIIHRDIKAGNILLDQNLNPKISDFGMARLIRGDNTLLRTRIAGTYGYMAPEYAMMGQLSVKVDVFSFGVLVLEILSGRKNTDLNLPREMQILLHWAWGLYIRGQALDIMDSSLGDLIPEEQVVRCIHIGLLCAQADATARPPMSSIFLMLSSNSIALPNPTIPGFVRVTQTEESLAFNRKDAAGLSRTSAASSSASSHSPLVPSSRNDVSITQVEGR